MIKLLFLDNREIESVEGFTRKLQQPRKHRSNPLLVADQPWENGNFTLYGSVVRADGKPFQLWYSCVQRPWNIVLCYAESDDGLVWRRPRLDFHRHRRQQTNILMDADVHGAAVIYDQADCNAQRRYKMLAGTAPCHLIRGFVSPDGIHWTNVTRFPVLPFNPDCPMGLVRTHDGRYAAYHRTVYGRRVCRSESWDFRTWASEPRLVLEPDAGDSPQTQFYGLGSVAYGPYELGTLWIFHTDPTELRTGKMRGYQQCELVYARSGYAWHRAAQGEMFLPHGRQKSWDRGNVQPASQPVFLDNEIRYYYAGTSINHDTQWELKPQKAGLGMATLKPDRFVALAASQTSGRLMTVCTRLPSLRLFINAAVEPDGWIRAEILDSAGRPIAPFTAARCEVVRGDSIEHPLKWRAGRGAPRCPDGPVRVRLIARNCRIFSLYCLEPEEKPVYHKFRAWDQK